MSNESSNPLENIKVGDWVKIQKNWDYTSNRRAIEFAQVTKVTPKQFITGGSQYACRFWKGTGQTVQTFGYADTRFDASIATEAEVQADLQRQQKEKMIKSLIEDLQSNPEKFPLELIEDWIEAAHELGRRALLRNESK
jgi:uncharacterized protein YodC (DUF2158 family)